MTLATEPAVTFFLANTLKELLPMQVRPVRLGCSQFGASFESRARRVWGGEALFYLDSDAVRVFGDETLALKTSEQQKVW